MSRILPLVALGLLITLAASPAVVGQTTIVYWGVDCHGYSHFIGDNINVTVTGQPGTLPLIQVYNETWVLEGAPLRIDLGPFGNQTTVVPLFIEAYTDGLHYMNVTVNDTTVAWTTLNLIFDQDRIVWERLNRNDDDHAGYDANHAAHSQAIRDNNEHDDIQDIIVTFTFFQTTFVMFYVIYNVAWDKHGSKAANKGKERAADEGLPFFTVGRITWNNVGSDDREEVERMDDILKRSGAPVELREDVARTMLGKWGYIARETPVASIGSLKLSTVEVSDGGDKNPGYFARQKARKAAKKAAKPKPAAKPKEATK